MPVAIVLAAGQSNRLGQPKALLFLGDSTLIGEVVSCLAEVCEEVVVVTRAELQVDIMLAAPGARVVVNQNPEAGRTGSIQVGLRALENPPRVLLAPVDRPGFSVGLLRSLLACKRSTRPVFAGRGGHPVLLVKRDTQEILKSATDTPLKDLVRFEDIVVDEEYLHLNVDTDDDLALLSEWYSSQRT